MVNGDLETSYLYGIEGEEIYKEEALNNFEDGYTILLHDADVLFPQVFTSLKSTAAQLVAGSEVCGESRGGFRSSNCCKPALLAREIDLRAV